MLDGKQIKQGSITNDRLATPAGTPVTSNKDMAASATALDGDVACATALTATPASHSFIRIHVNGLAESLGDGVKTKSCYFSGDNGTTARAFSAIVAGDKLYWNGTVAGYQLTTADRIDFDYNA